MAGDKSVSGLHCYSKAATDQAISLSMVQMVVKRSARLKPGSFKGISHLQILGS